jgi:hypothetical protein
MVLRNEKEVTKSVIVITQARSLTRNTTREVGCRYSGMSKKTKRKPKDSPQIPSDVRYRKESSKRLETDTREVLMEGQRRMEKALL